MASNPYSRDSSRTWSTRSCVEQFGIYRETPVKPYNYYKNNSRFIRTGVVAVMLAIVILLVFLMISDISKTNGAHRSREKDAFLRLLSASQENNNKTPTLPPTLPSPTPDVTTTPQTTPPPTKPPQTQHPSNHRPNNEPPVQHFDVVDYDWSEPNADRKLQELTRLRPPNRRYDEDGQDIHIHIPGGYGTPSRGLRPPTQSHRVFTAPDGSEHHEISYTEPKPVHRDIPLHWDAGYKSNSVYHGERVAGKQRRPDSFERPIVVLDDPVKGHSQKRQKGSYQGQPVLAGSGYYGPTVPSVIGYHGKPVPAVTGYHNKPGPSVTGYHNKPGPSVTGYHNKPGPSVTGYHGSTVPSVTGYHGPTVPSVKGYNGPVKPRQPVPAVTDYRVYNHHAHNLTDVHYKTASASDAYPQYWRPYLDDLSHGSSKKETRIVNRNPGNPLAKPKLKARKNATRHGTPLNKFPQLLNYHYPKDAKNIGDIIRYLNRFEPPQKEDTTPLFDANLGKIMKLKGVYVTHVNDDAEVESTSNGHAYNADPFQAYKPDNMADINYMLYNELHNNPRVKNTIRHLAEQKRNERVKYFPRPPEHATNAATSHQSYNSPVDAYTTAIYHPWPTNAPRGKTTTSKPSPMSVMLDVYPMEAVEGSPSKGVKRKPAKTIKMNLDKVAAATGKKQQMILHLNLYPRKKLNSVSRADVAESDSSTGFNVNFNSDTHEIVPVKRYYNEDYEGEIRRADDDYYDDEIDDDYEQNGERINATLDNKEFKKTVQSNATLEREYEREGEEVDLRINIEDYVNDGDFEFDEDTTKGDDAVENVSEKPPQEKSDGLVTVFPLDTLERLDSLLGEKSRYVVRSSQDFGREDVLSALNSEVQRGRDESDNAS